MVSVCEDAHYDPPSVAFSSLPRARPLSRRYMFKEATMFNQPISAWDVSQVTTMAFVCGVLRARWSPVCEDAHSDPPSVASSSLPRARPLSRSSMFYSADAFNQPISGWDTSKVTLMEFVF